MKKFIEGTKVIDITGQIINGIEAVKFIKIENHKSIWLWRCHCGNLFESRLDNVKSGKTKSCGCSREIDYTGQIFNECEAIKSIGKDKRGNYIWLWKCSCGNLFKASVSDVKRGNIRSCGCAYYKKPKDYTGQIFNGCEAIKFLRKDKHGSPIWLWKCSCGNYFEARVGSVKNDGRKCGCGRRKDYTGQIFNGCEAIKYLRNDEQNGSIWLWKCSCGNYFECRAGSVVSGRTRSCGCLNEPIGESNIKNILDENNLTYITQYTFKDCRNINPLHFDFFVEGKWCIEFDGPQHYQSKNRWGGEEALEIRQKRDKIKDEYCLDNNIPLIRIPYSKRDNMIIEDLTPETSKYLVKVKKD